MPVWSGRLFPSFKFKNWSDKSIVTGKLKVLISAEGFGGNASDPINETEPSRTPKSLAGKESILISTAIPLRTKPILSVGTKTFASRFSIGTAGLWCQPTVPQIRNISAHYCAMKLNFD